MLDNVALRIPDHATEKENEDWCGDRRAELADFK